MASVLGWLWSRKASAIALIAIIFDALLHYLLPDAIAIREGLLYFVVKYIVVEIAASVMLSVKMGKVLSQARPFLIGLVGSSAFGLIYYELPWISSEPGYLTLPYRLLWGVFHALVIWAAAAFVMRKPRQVALAVVLLVVAVAVGVVASLVLGY